MRKRLAIVAAGFVMSLNASADELAFQVTPFGGYRFGGDFEVQDSTTSVDLDDSSSFGLLLNARHSNNTTWELLYSKQQTDAQLGDSMAGFIGVKTDLSMLQIGGTYHGDGDKLQPYVALTVGGTHIRTSGNGPDSDTFFSGSIGIGMNVAPNNHLGLRVEARAYGTLTDSSTDLFCQTGPDINICALRIDGTLLNQIEIFAGLTFRF